MTVRVLVGDALSVLRTLPSESVQVCVTSPPYFGLRSYSTDPQVWGGDPDHQHVWGDAITTAYANKTGQQAMDGKVWDVGMNGPAHDRPRAAGAFCPCGAWRGELGSEPTPALYLEHLLSIFDEVKRVLRPDGTCWVNLGDSYAGNSQQGGGGRGATSWLKNGKHGDADSQHRAGSAQGIPAKNLLLVPQRFAIAMQDDGWIVRSEIAWCKKASMPESVRDRPSSAWEHIWMFSKSARYFYDGDAVRQPGVEPDGRARGPKLYTDGGYHRNGIGSETLGTVTGSANLRNVWTIGPSPFADAHFATFPPEIPRRCILAGTSEKGACPACGAPWARVVERGANPDGILGRGNGRHIHDFNPLAKGVHVDAASKHIGWQPGCSCPPADPVPQVVLDPFLGSGTTAMVADRLGRDCVGIELNETYARMAEDRITWDAGTLFGEPVAVEAPTQPGLFDSVL